MSRKQEQRDATAGKGLARLKHCKKGMWMCCCHFASGVDMAAVLMLVCVAGVPRSQLAELHGNCFAERCKKCKSEYVRDFEMDTVSALTLSAMQHRLCCYLDIKASHELCSKLHADALRVCTDANRHTGSQKFSSCP